MEGPLRTTEKELPLAEEVFRVVGAAIEVHRELGAGFLEAVYQEALALEFREREIPCLAQVPLDVNYKNHRLEKRYAADFIAFEDILVELKAADSLTSRDTAQLINYLHATHKPLDLLINFGSTGKLEWKRLVNTRPPSRPF